MPIQRVENTGLLPCLVIGDAPNCVLLRSLERRLQPRKEGKKMDKGLVKTTEYYDSLALDRKVSMWAVVWFPFGATM